MNFADLATDHGCLFIELKKQLLLKISHLLGINNAALVLQHQAIGAGFTVSVRSKNAITAHRELLTGLGI